MFSVLQLLKVFNTTLSLHLLAVQIIPHLTVLLSVTQPILAQATTVVQFTANMSAHSLNQAVVQMEQFNSIKPASPRTSISLLDLEILVSSQFRPAADFLNSHQTQPLASTLISSKFKKVMELTFQVESQAGTSLLAKSLIQHQVVKPGVQLLQQPLQVLKRPDTTQPTQPLEHLREVATQARASARPDNR